MQSIHVGIRLRYRGKEEAVAIRVHANDPKMPEAGHTILARNVAPFVVSPAAIDFGTLVEDGKARSATVRVLSPDGKPLAADVTVSAATVNDHLAVQPDDSASGERSFRVTLQPSVPRGHFSGTITLHVSTDPTPYDVAVTAHVCGPIAFAPQTVYLATTSGPGQECSILVWRTDGQPLGNLIDQQVPLGITLERDANETALRQRLKISASGSWDSSVPSQVRLRYEKVFEEIVIEVRPREAPHAASGAPAGSPPG
jgi:hypothetical protein